MKNKILNMIKQGWVSLITDDSNPYPQAQATVNKRPTKFIRLSTYGVFGNPPKDSHVVLFSSQGNESNKFGIINDFLRRKKVKEGECGLLNTLTGKYLYLKENGNLEIFESGDFAVRYLELEKAFNQLKSDHDAVLNLLQTWTVAPNDGGQALKTAMGSLSASTADITPAKISEIDLPPVSP